jgi:hypothetical protein
VLLFCNLQGFATNKTLDQTGPKLEEPEMVELSVKEVVASIMGSSATGQVINALNMPSSASHPDMDIYR